MKSFKKRSLVFLLILVMSFLLISCKTTNGEISATKMYTTENEDGLSMEITFYGFSDKSRGLDFYVKSDDYFTLDVKIKNNSDKTYYHGKPHIFSDGFDPYDLAVEMSDKNGNALDHSSYEKMISYGYEVWDIVPGWEKSFKIKLAAGKYDAAKYDDFDLAVDGNAMGGHTGITLYKDEIYKDGLSDFSGIIKFSYAYEYEQLPNTHPDIVPNEALRTAENNKSIGSNVNITVMKIS